MPYIIIDDEQARILAESNGQVEVRDRAGQHLGYVSLDFSAEEIAEAKRRLASDEPRYTTREVLEHLQNLER